MGSDAHVDSSNICWTFAKTGQCPRGAACRWIHEVLLKDPSDTVCRAWRLWGTCPRFEQCTWDHPPVAVKWPTILSSQRLHVQDYQFDARYWGIAGASLQMNDVVGKAEPQLNWSYSLQDNAYRKFNGDNDSAIAQQAIETWYTCYQPERQMQPWNETCDTSSAQLTVIPVSLNELEDMSDATGSWDQFETNKTRFGVKSTFTEDLSQYTTQLNLSDVPLDVQQKASQIAEEIEKEHRAGIDSDGYRVGVDDDDDEESKFSSVTRMPQQLQ